MKMKQEDWRKFGEIQYIKGRLDEMFKLDKLVDLDMPGIRLIDARISKYMKKLETLDALSYELYLVEKQNMQHKIRKLTQ
tara:strand:+ start:16108 stop:16347 length:240 start_codon:yes stop_codon:yes gene_type:complete